MTTPGSNLLRKALRAIKPQTVRLYRDVGRVTSATGRDVTQFSEGTDIREGSVQAVPLTRYAAMGLDFKKVYVTWFVAAHALGVDRDRSGDQFEWNNARYSIHSESDWFSQDGWVAVVGVRIVQFGNSGSVET